MKDPTERHTEKNTVPVPRKVVTPSRHWSWSDGSGPHALRIGNIVYVGGQVSLPQTGNSPESQRIESQTAKVFSDMVALLQEAGGSMADLIKLHTYYVYEGGGSAITAYWERMTQVRLKYLANPGPAATAVRVVGVPVSSCLIGIDGIAVIGGEKQRIMPKFTWDWSISTPFSQGWRVGNKIYVGGQISADMQGKAIGVEDIRSQTTHVLELIKHVLLDGGATWADLATLRICYKHSLTAGHARNLHDQILEIVRDTIPGPGPAITAFGADLLYEGLLLEIDGVAVLERYRTAVSGNQLQAPSNGFPDAWQTGAEVYFGGLSAVDGDTLTTQTSATIQRLTDVLSEAEATLHDLVKLTVFFVAGTPDADQLESQVIRKLLRENLPEPGPIMTFVQVASLPAQNQRIQIDGVCLLGSQQSGCRE